ncbi:MAG: hypothetical protein LCH52_03870 [Bacteroidetes bacterium]|nr:hypothetical protein [Bacteroidota bacterium]
MPYHKNELSENDKIEIVKLYKAKMSLGKLSARYKVGVQQITDALDEAGIPRKRNKKQIASGWKDNEKRPDTITVTKATPEYFDYLTDIMAQAGRMKGDPVANYEMLSKQNPFKGIKRHTITKHRK